MKLVFYANYLNIHQVYLMDEFYALLGDGFRFVSTLPRNNRELKGGSDYSSRPYCILAGESETAHKFALSLAIESDVCVFGACSQEYAIERSIRNQIGLSFEMGERWLKRGWVNVFSPVFRKWVMNYRRYYRHLPFYKLCCGSYTASDDRRMCLYPGRHYKWGYFTNVSNNADEEYLSSSLSGTISMMWCSRLLKWKHPELVIQLAAMLKRDGHQVQLDMYGSGPEQDATSLLCHQLDVSDVVSFKESVPNEDILRAMRLHDIFLFTSDHNEGWGAVLNEAMSSHCAVVASDEIGSAPYLIEDGRNGFLFKSRKIDSLYEKVTFLLNNPAVIQQVSEQAYQDMLHKWSPRKAAENLIRLINDLRNGQDTSIMEGPCSKAE